jgi:hypothetical protein
MFNITPHNFMAESPSRIQITNGKTSLVGQTSRENNSRSSPRDKQAKMKKTDRLHHYCKPEFIFFAPLTFGAVPLFVLCTAIEKDLTSQDSVPDFPSQVPI